MNKSITKKFKRLIENSDAQLLEEELVKYATEAIDDVFIHDNAHEGVEKMDTCVKFFQDLVQHNPRVIGPARARIMEYMQKRLTETFEKLSAGQELKDMVADANTMADLLYLLTIEENLINCLRERDVTYLELALETINELKQIKMDRLDPKKLGKMPEKVKDETAQYKRVKELNDLVEEVNESITNPHDQFQFLPSQMQKKIYEIETVKNVK